MTDHDHGEWYRRERKKHEAYMAEVNADLDAWLADENWDKNRYRPSFWIRHSWVIGCMIGAPSGVCIGLALKWWFGI